MADTALKTANSGYLTRRLVDVVQDFVVDSYDCGTPDEITINLIGEENLSDKILGRIVSQNVPEPYGNGFLIKENEEINDSSSRLIQAGIQS